MERIRILLVDDSVVVRKILSGILSKERHFEVVGVAANGSIAFAKISQLHPDIVILDMDMPVLNGLETLKKIRQKNSSLPVIMFSALTERGAVATLEALSSGANDYITKPSNLESIEEALESVKKQLISKINVFCGHSVSRKIPRSCPASPLTKPGREQFQSDFPNHRIDVVAIGVSTGGPDALAKVLSELPSNFPLPILITQHMPAVFTNKLAENLSRHSLLPVKEGVSGEEVLPGTAWLAPGNYHMVVVKSGEIVRIQINQGPQVNSCRPAVDPLFYSVAEAYGRHVLAVLLTGMGHDGLEGCRSVRKENGYVIVQDKASSVVWGMPGAVSDAGLAHKVIPLKDIGDEIIQITRINRIWAGPK